MPEITSTSDTNGSVLKDIRTLLRSLASAASDGEIQQERLIEAVKEITD
jgi:hypothetical protein